MCFSKLQQTGIFVPKLENRKDTSDQFATDSSNRGTCKSPMQHGYEQKIQKHVGNTGNYNNAQTEVGLFGSYKEALEYILQHETGQ